MAEFIPSFVENEEQREVIIKLGHMITNRIPYRLGLKKLTKYDPEYWGLSLMLTDEQAEAILPIVKKAVAAVSADKGASFGDDKKANYTAEELATVMECIDEICAILGWTYKTELEDGIRLSYEDFLNNPMRAER